MPYRFAAILDRHGEVLCSRQFCDLTRSETLSLVHAFHENLVKTSDTEMVFAHSSYRGIFRALDEVLLLLCADFDDNIAQSLDIMQLFVNVCAQICPNMKETTIEDKMFDLIVAFDEIIFDGVVLTGSVDEIMERIAMVSKSEELANIDEQRKVHSAIALGKEKAKILKQQKKERMLKTKQDPLGSADLHMATLDDIQAIRDADKALEHEYINATKPSLTRSTGTVDLIDDILGLELRRNTQKSSAPNERVIPSSHVKYPAELSREDAKTDNEAKLYLETVESISADLIAKGGYRNLRIEGSLRMQSTNYHFQQRQVTVAGVNKEMFDFKINAEMDKQLFAQENILAPRFPEGVHLVNDTMDILRWHSKQADIPPPISLSFWPRSRSMMVEFDVDRKYPMEELVIEIPLGGARIQSVQAEVGECLVDKSGTRIRWAISANMSGMFEGVLRVMFREDLVETHVLPIRVTFASQKTFSGVEPRHITSLASGALMPFEWTSSMKSAEYVLR